MTPEPIPPTPCHPPPGATGEDFRTTRWTQVSRAKVDSPEGRRALAELCNAYYEPVTTFLRCKLRDEDAAREFAHDFFAHLLAGGTIAGAEQERGRFRSYLLGAVKHFLSNQYQARQRLKRGGGAPNISLNETEACSVPDASVLSPDAAFDRQWALTVVALALEALRQECVAEGRGEFFELAKPWLTGDTGRGDQAALAASCGMNANTLKVAVHRLKRRFRRLLKAEVAGTLDDPGLVEEEMRALFDALGN
jgi:DNA-directed RNA polymerase specialized sigma24 family protein